MNKYLGFSSSADFYNCKADLNDNDMLHDLMYDAVNKAGCTAVGSVSHCYNPRGYSAVIIIQESHLSVHTWPEHKMISIDTYVCGEESKIMVNKIISHFKEVLNPCSITEAEMFRGNKLFIEKINE